MKVAQDIRELLDEQARLINSPEFIANDPVQFPRLFDRLQDIEIVALLSSAIAWGNRKMICRNCQKMIDLMDGRPYQYVMDQGYEELPDQNIHRTFFARDLRHLLRGMKLIFDRYGSVQGLAAAAHIDKEELPAWALVAAMNDVIAEANDGVRNSRCMPQNLDTTALKRVNMALRWLVRNDGIVDMGVWDVIKPSQLYIPLDVHVGNVSRQLGLLDRHANDKRSAVQLTDTLRTLRPDDPVLYDYALFGIGVNHKQLAISN
ncbi:MAG: TIGR02757 family protein [Muribaculaceae bacterium]|nr:TIGR02757 family protein [Muribaculaceae bacterium]MDE6320731.1 TIGR02757 family protein [Muribaculaceae bacterium]